MPRRRHRGRQPLRQPRSPLPPQGEAAAPALDLTWLDLAALGWAAGGAAFLLWQGGRYLAFRRRLLRGARPFPAGDALAQTLAQALGGGKAIPVVVCAAAPSPLTLGLLHPRVVLPREDYSREALAGILCHELAHWQGGPSVGEASSAAGPGDPLVQSPGPLGRPPGGQGPGAGL